MNVVDSSGWLAYLADEPAADFFAGPIEDTDRLVVPSISLLEVFKRVLMQRDEHDALQAIALMRQAPICDLDADLALQAAVLGRDHRLPMADSIILATARRYGALLWTQDSDFDGIEGVRYVGKD